MQVAKMVYRLVAFLTLALLLPAAALPASSLLINEILASNALTNADELGEFDDWVELYNAGDLAEDAGGLYLSDDISVPQKWRIPDDSPSLTTIPPRGYLLIWLDDASDQGPLHAKLKLSSGGETLVLSERDGQTQIDAISFGRQRSDVSLGRSSDGGPDWRFFTTPTPSQANGGASFSAITGDVVFSEPGGLYPGPLKVELTAPQAEARIFVTRDGSTPTPHDSLAYTGALEITGKEVLRARAYVDGQLPGAIITQSYLLGVKHSLSIVSLVTDPKNLWDQDSGIYVRGDRGDTNFPYIGSNFWQDWERPAHFEYFTAEGQPELRIDAGIKIAGSWSRGWDKKSITVVTRGKFGTPRINYRFFDDKDIESFEGILLRADTFESGGWRMKNELLYEVNKATGRVVDMQAYRPAILYLNGEYWGIYNIMERKGLDFVQSNFGQTDVDILKNHGQQHQIVTGDIDNYQALLRFLRDENIREDRNYERALSWMDMPNFIDYWIYELYAGKGDNQNIRYWRPRRPDGRWRWIGYDYDWWNHYKGNDLTRLIEREVAYDFWLLGTMLRNERFRYSFLNRCADMFNSYLHPEQTLAHLDKIVNRIEEEVPAEIIRWNAESNKFTAAIAYMFEHLSYRPDTLRQQLIREYELGGSDTLTLDVDIAGGGSLKVSTLTIEKFPWVGEYFFDVPLRIEAIPSSGYEFVGWENSELGDGSAKVIEVLLNGPLDVKALFRPAGPQIVINEINYKSSSEFDPDDWVELFNTSTEPADLSGWVLKDDDDAHEFVIPEGTVVAGEGFLVVTRDLQRFGLHFPSVVNVTGNMDFGLGSDGDAVRLFNADNDLMDIVEYRNSWPWPPEANGKGVTLVLLDPLSDNSLARNWHVSRHSGSPAAPNVPDGTEGEPPPPVPELRLAQNKPNPFYDETELSFVLPRSASVRLEVFDLLGRSVAVLAEGSFASGSHSLRWSSSGIPRAQIAAELFFCRLTMTNPVSGERQELLIKMLRRH